MKTVKWHALLLALILSAATRAGAAEPNVVVSIYPLHSLAAGVMAGIAKPILLLESGTSPHDFALKPSQARLLQSADLIIWIGEGLEYPLTRFVENLPPGRSLPLTAPDAGRQQNLHIWLDPDRAQLIVSTLVDKLSALDPEHAARYRANGAQLNKQIGKLASELELLLRPYRNAPYIVYHDAYSHFERRFGLTNQGAVTSDEEHRPGASHIRHIRATIAASGARCIFLEPQFEPQILAAITEDRDIRVGELDPLGVDLVPGVNGFFHLMRNLARGFANCLSQP
jgi:zinc transport system substrate-binding protein